MPTHRLICSISDNKYRKIRQYWSSGLYLQCVICLTTFVLIFLVHILRKNPIRLTKTSWIMEKPTSTKLSRRDIITKVIPACALTCIAPCHALGMSEPVKKKFQVHKFDTELEGKMTSSRSNICDHLSLIYGERVDDFSRLVSRFRCSFVEHLGLDARPCHPYQMFR